VGRALALDPDDWSVRQGYMVHRKTGVIRRISKTVQKASVAVLVHAPNRVSAPLSAPLCPSLPLFVPL